MTGKFLAGLVVLAIVLGLVFVRSKKESVPVSCSQNTGPFGQVGQPDIDKAKVRQQLLVFYNLCLAGDYKQGYLTDAINQNSESQAYALLQSYLAGDKLTFARVLSWTNANLKRSSDNLLSWKYSISGKSFFARPFFASKTVSIQDPNSATDADTDFAYALLLAGRDWNRPEYTDMGKRMVSDIWDKEVVELNGKLYAIAGNWANKPDKLVINPSYFSPQAYRLFAIDDISHQWLKLADDGYALLQQISNHGANQPYIPSDWIVVNKSDNSVGVYTDKPDSRNYSYDAFRTFWRTAIDQLNTPNFGSWTFISAATQFDADWKASQQACALYLFQSDSYACDHSTTSTLAAPLAVLSVTNGYEASQLVQKYYLKGDTLEFPDTQFYAKSWHFFGAWLWSHS